MLAARRAPLESVADVARAVRVLVVDPDEERLDELEAFLTDLFEGRCHVDRVPTGEDALVSLRARPYHLVLSEERLPRMGGVETFERARREQPDAVRILVTEGMDTEALAAAINSGRIFRLVTRPWTGPEMEEVLRNALDWRHSGRAMRLLLEEQQRVHQELVASLQAMEETQRQMVHVERLATVGRLTSGIIHEVRNQLTGLLGVFSTLRYGEGSVAELAERGHLIVKQLAARIATIESFARAGGWTYDVEEVELGALLAQVTALHDQEDRRGGLLVAAHPEVRAIRLRADLAKLAHALVALVREGHERFGGAVRLRADGLDEDTVELRFAGQAGGGVEAWRVGAEAEPDPSHEVATMVVDAHEGWLEDLPPNPDRTYARVVLPRRARGMSPHA